MGIREYANQIIYETIKKVLPDEAVARALEGKQFGEGRIRVVATGKAAWQMAKTAAAHCLKNHWYQRKSFRILQSSFSPAVLTL